MTAYNLKRKDYTNSLWVARLALKCPAGFTLEKNKYWKHWWKTERGWWWEEGMEELVLEWEEVQMRDREPGKQNKRPWNKDRKLCSVRETETLGEMEKRQISAAPELRGLRSLALLPITEKSSSAGIQCCWATAERKVSSKSKERRGLGDEWGSNVKRGTEDEGSSGFCFDTVKEKMC